MPPALRRLGRIAAHLLGALALLAFVYLLAATTLSTIPRHRGWRPPTSGGVPIWIEDNGIHTGIVMPKRAAGVDWTRDFPPGDIADPRYAAHDHIAIGWGERQFFLGTPTWWDVRPTTVLRAALGSDQTLLHVEHVAQPVARSDVRRILLRPDEYRRLVAVLRASRRVGPALPGYAGYDAFYPAHGHYDALNTCNTWIGNRLADAGVRVGWWTPFSASVMQWF